ncbi:MAG: aromatic ring-hydroxylating dioxygenase subunit alpha [Polyangiaceae bacterium]|nr:aromatic ring-hydroxylating dioxygenase subunit alpha [Polyangiaceae bacterium]
MDVSPESTHHAAREGSLAERARRAGMSFNHWYPAAFSHELRRGKTLAVTFWGEPIALYRADDGSPHALEDRCPHRGIKLSHGSVEGCRLVCLYHGWSFDPAGKLVEMKHDTFGKKLPTVTVRRYPARERYGIVWIFPGAAELAALTPLPEIPFAEGPDAWASLSFAYTWQAHHSMVIDNLCNLTHLWVHGRWVPYGETVLAAHTAEQDRLTLRWDHELRRDLLHPFTAPFFRSEPGGNRSETFMIYDYPYQSALSNRRVRSTNFMLPIDASRTKVFSLQLWQPLAIPFAGGRRWPRQLAALAMPFIRPITMEIFRQDGFTVEEEQVAWTAQPARPFPELNPMVKHFNQLGVRKWEQYVAYRASGTLGEAERAEQTRVKVL